MLQLIVQRGPLEESGRGVAFLTRADMEREGLVVDDVLELATAGGRSLLARVGLLSEEEPSGRVVRLDRYLREGLKARVGDNVTVQKVSPGPIKRLMLVPLLDVTPTADLSTYLAQDLSKRRMPASHHAILYVTLPEAVTATDKPVGVPFRVALVEPGPGIITTDTAVEVASPSPGSGWGAEVTFDDVGGMGKEIQEVRELVELPLRHPESYRHLGISPPRGIILHGPAGVGKTHLAKALATELRASFFYVNGPDIVGAAYGETEANLRRVFQEAGEHAPSILLVDEVDVLSPKRGESGTQADTRMSTQFLALLDGIKASQGVMVIGTTNRIESLDPSFRRPGRFDRELFIGPPDVTARLEVLRIHTRSMPLSQEAEDFLEEVAQRTVGFVGADIMELCREAALSGLRRQVPPASGELGPRDQPIPVETLMVERQDLESAVGRVRPSALRETYLTPTDVGWEDVGGLREAKERLRQAVEYPLLHPGAFADMKLEPPRGVLLYGPPGTGKTLLAKAIAKECRANFISVQGSDLLSPWMGQSEEMVRHIFRIARQVAPTIVFFDQMDTITPRRGIESMTTRVMERVVTQILAEMDGMEPLSGVAVVGATNRVDLLDAAILAPGRLGVHISLPLPDETERREILAIHLRGTPLESPDPSALLYTVASKTEGYSGAELQALCRDAKLAALGRVGYKKAVPVKKSDFLNALKAISRSRLAISGEQATSSPKGRSSP